MENRLRQLWNLQQIDSNLDELQEMKGDLPAIVRELDAQIQAKLAQKKEMEELIKRSFVARDTTDVEILALKEKIEKYKAQQFQVKTNKQYDALGREIDQSQERIATLTKEMEILEGKAVVAKGDVEKLLPDLESLQAEFKDRSKELDAVNKEHEEEELRLNHQREKAVARIQKGDYQMYERIRKAKDGKAIVPVKRNACGGCFNRVPPQRVLELRKNAALMTCERCGRVLVSDEISSTKIEGL